MVEYPEYRASLRAVSQLSGADGGVSKPSLTVGELEGALSPEVCPTSALSSESCLIHQNGVSWRIIHELLKYGFSTELESVTDEQRAAIMINRVHGFGKIRALALYASSIHLPYLRDPADIPGLKLERDRWMICSSLKKRSMAARSLLRRRYLSHLSHMWYPADRWKLAIKYHKEMELMIPRKVVEVFRQLIEKALKEADPGRELNSSQVEAPS